MNVYLISSEVNGKKVYKIGRTRRSVDKRLSEFKTGNSAILEIVDVFNSKWGTKIETYLHKHFGTKRLGGEWFELSDNDINDFSNLCLQVHENLSIIEDINTYYIDRGGRF